MRYWNGLKFGDYVMYHKKVYSVIKLYEKNNQRLCDLISTIDKITLKGISVYDCEKVPD